MQQNNNHISKTRGIYFLRLIGRIIVFLIAILIYIFDRNKFNIADGWNFFNEFSPLHLLWIIWMWDMVLQFIPVKVHISIGSQKVFESLFRPIKEKINYKNLKQYIKDTTAAAYKGYGNMDFAHRSNQYIALNRNYRHRCNGTVINILLCV